METFPQRILSETKNNEEEDDDERDHDNNDGTVCSICLVDFDAGDAVRDLPCKHFFHLSCVDNWLRSESTCPLCRESCRPAVDAREQEQQQHQRSVRPPFVLTRIIALLRGDTRDRGYVVDDGDDNDGLELGSIYALELQEDHDDDNDDDVSVLSNFSSSVRTTVSHRSAEPTDDGIDRRRRRRRRGAPRGGGEGSVPLTAVSDSAMV
ncbi:finger protein [Fragilaria crotonensis]|nr:finger protein [Fragilaria crotonensis]